MKIFDLTEIECAKNINPMYEKWIKFMLDNVEFWLKSSDIHTKLHCARVMMYSLLIGKEKGLCENDMTALAHASAFHDSRRMDDWSDVGHGKRAAEYYDEYCKGKDDIIYDKRASIIMAFHDRDDEKGIKAIDDYDNGVLLYQIFKDSDALDRFRLGEHNLDVSMLRTKEAVDMVKFARELCKKTSVR